MSKNIISRLDIEITISKAVAETTEKTVKTATDMIKQTIKELQPNAVPKVNLNITI